MPATLPLPTLAAHKQALAACRRCAGTLPPGVRPVVSDAVAPRLMLLGQAPGQREATAGRAFLGRAGRTLFQWLARAGLPEDEARRTIHFAAVTRCYPGPHPAGRGDRVPSPAERAACAPWLDAELRLVAPPLVVPVGRLAVDRLLGTAALAEVVGGVHAVGLPGGPARVVPLPHPSGASGWLNLSGHRALLDRALAVLADELRALGPHDRAAEPSAGGRAA